MEDLQQLLENEDCINIRDDHDNTLLHTILTNSSSSQTKLAVDRAVIKQLLDWGLDINSKNLFGYSPLQYAVSNPDCSLDVIKMLLERGASIDLIDNYGNSALHHTLRKSNYAVIELLIARGADVNIVNNDGDSPLNHAVSNSKWDAFNLNSNLGGNNCVKLDVVKLLLDHKPDVNLKNNFGDSPLHYAVNNCICKQDLVKLLLKRGTNLNLVNNAGDSSLHRAIGSCEINPRVVMLLLDYGAKVNIKNNYGEYPLYLAVKNPSCPLNTLKLLLDRGADVLACNKSGEYPLRKAVQDCQRDDSALDRVKLLIKYTLTSSLGFNIHKVIKSTKYYSLLAKFCAECTMEIFKMGGEKVGNVSYKELPNSYAVTLYEFMRGYQEIHLVERCAKMKARAFMNNILKVLHAKKFPHLGEVIMSKVKRKDMIEKMKKLLVYVVKQDSDKVVVLDFYSVCGIARYLVNDDLLNFIMAYHFGNKPSFEVVDFPRQFSILGKRSAEEPNEYRNKRFKLEEEEIKVHCKRII